MITAYSFKHAYALHQSGQSQFRLLQEQAIILLDLCPQPGRHVSNALEVTAPDIDWRRGKPEAVMHHSDRGSQYTSEQFQRLLVELGVTCSAA